MSDIQHDLARLALAEAIVKSAKAMTNPRGGAHGADNLRTRCDAALRGLYETAGVSQQQVNVNGQRVGTLSARLSKPASGVRLQVEDMAAYRTWLSEGDGRVYADAVLAEAEQAVMSHAMEDGVVPDGCRAVKYEEPAHWLGTTLKVDAAKVQDALGPELPGAVAGFLGAE